MKDISICMITVNRAPRKNYLFDTLDSLIRGGVFTSERFAAMHVCDSKRDMWAQSTLATLPVDVHYPPDGECRTPTENAGLALGAAAADQMPWVLFLEDDIDVCDHFLDSVGAWLDDHARESRRIYPFGAAYAGVVFAQEAGKSCWDYPIEGFYGTQAFAVRGIDAMDLAVFLLESQEHSGYDLLMHKWARNRWPHIKHFLTSVPSFVEHTGRESVINPRRHTHTFPAWAGHEYSYRAKVRA
jgi:hypothetical protein